jgi:Tat protein secretion system quality control protein TatD with DNase activity
MPATAKAMSTTSSNIKTRASYGFSARRAFCTKLGLEELHHEDGHEHMQSSIAFDAHNHIHLSREGGIPPLSSNEMMLASRGLQGQPRLNEVENTSDVEGDTIDLTLHAHKILDALRIQGVYRGATSSVDADADADENNAEEQFNFQLGGIALMSTQPRDFPIVKNLSDAILPLSQKDIDEKEKTDYSDDDVGTHSTMEVVRNYGVHPWFLRQAQSDFAGIRYRETAFTTDVTNTTPTWLPYLKQKLESDPLAHVGEIGLDGARYEIDPDTNEKTLVSTMESQIEAFEAQMHLAADMNRSVSLHAVRCWGPLMDSLRRLKGTRSKMRKETRIERKKLKRELELCNEEGGSSNADIFESYRQIDEDVLLFPRKIYFHAFGGKAALVDQLDAICRDKSSESSATSKNAVETFYGFAPVVNFRSHKTAAIVRKVGINRLVLETDVEDYARVNADLKSSIEYIAEALEMEEEEVLRHTRNNARRLYGLT